MNLIEQAILARDQGLEYGGVSWCQVPGARVDTRTDAQRSASRTGHYQVVHYHPNEMDCPDVECEVVVPDYTWAGSNPPGTYPAEGGEVACATEKLR